MQPHFKVLYRLQKVWSVNKSILNDVHDTNTFNNTILRPSAEDHIYLNYSALWLHVIYAIHFILHVWNNSQQKGNPDLQQWRHFVISLTQLSLCGSSHSGIDASQLRDLLQHRQTRDQHRSAQLCHIRVKVAGNTSSYPLSLTLLYSTISYHSQHFKQLWYKAGGICKLLCVKLLTLQAM